MMKESKTILSCQNLNFSYSGKTILKDISLEFKEGEFIALLGKNGAGKSTLLSCLSGLKDAKQDQLLLEGKDLTKASRQEIARSISFVPQEHEDIFPYSVLDVVVMGRTIFLGPFGAPSTTDFEKAMEALTELHAEHLAERIYTQLSGGEKQLVLLARALVQTKTMIFLDEPTNHLDYKNRYYMLASLKKLCKKHNTCVVACLHDPNHALLFADTTIMLADQEIIAQGPTKQVMTSSSVSKLYGIAVSQEDAIPATIQPSFVKPEFAGKVLLLLGSSGDGKTTTLQKTISRANLNDIKFSGIISPGTWKQNKRFSSIVQNIKTGENCLFAKREFEEGEDLGRFIFDEDGQALANKTLTTENNTDSDCIIIDEIGPLELKGQGHSPLIAPLVAMKKPKHIWAIRPSIVDKVISKWMLIDPVIVLATDPNASIKIEEFLRSNG